MSEYTQPSMFDLRGMATADEAIEHGHKILMQEIEHTITFENPRQPVIDATLDAAHDEWKAAYERYILTYASVAYEPFTAEDVRLAYEKSHGPQTKRQQASGGIFQRLAKQGKLRQAGTKRSKIYGNFLTSYRKGI